MNYLLRAAIMVGRYYTPDQFAQETEFAYMPSNPPFGAGKGIPLHAHLENAAEAHLTALEGIYGTHHAANYAPRNQPMLAILRPLRERWDDGERSIELCWEILETA